MLKKLSYSLLIAIALSFQLVAAPVSVAAAQCPSDSLLGLPAWYTYLECEEDPSDSERQTPIIEDAEDALPIGIAVLEGMIRLAGLVAVVMVFIGAFKFITSQGNGESAAAARKTIINALIGLVIVIIATAAVSFVGNSLA